MRRAAVLGGNDDVFPADETLGLERFEGPPKGKSMWRMSFERGSSPHYRHARVTRIRVNSVPRKHAGGVARERESCTECVHTILPHCSREHSRHSIFFLPNKQVNEISDRAMTCRIDITNITWELKSLLRYISRLYSSWH